MGLHIFSPPLSSRMGILDIISRIPNVAVLEYGSMGHMVYARQQLRMTYDKGADLYAAHINETDIALGGVETFVDGLAQLREDHLYKAIFNLPSTVPLTIGLFPGEWVQQANTGQAPVIDFETGGFECHVYEGMEEALCKVIEYVPLSERRGDEPRIHMMGLTAMEAPYQGDKEEMTHMIKEAFEGVIPVFYPEESCQVEKKDVVVALSEWALAGAKRLAEQWDVACLSINPYGYKKTVEALREIGQALGREPNAAYMDRMQKKYAPFLDKTMDISYYQNQKKVCITGSIHLCDGLITIAKELGISECIGYSMDQWESTAQYPYLSDTLWIQRVQELMAEGARCIGPEERLQYIGVDEKWYTSYAKGTQIPNHERPYRGFGGLDTWIDRYIK